MNPWVIAHDGTCGNEAYSLECQRCGEKQLFSLPISVESWIFVSKVFMNKHAKRTVSEKEDVNENG